MQGLSQLIVAFLELAEAEGRALRGGVLRVCIAIVVVLAAGLVAVGGLGFVIWALYLCIFQNGFDGDPGDQGLAAFLTGFVTLFIAGVTLWLAKKLG